MIGISGELCHWWPSRLPVCHYLLIETESCNYVLNHVQKMNIVSWIKTEDGELIYIMVTTSMSEDEFFALTNDQCLLARGMAATPPHCVNPERFHQAHGNIGIFCIDFSFCTNRRVAPVYYIKGPLVWNNLLLYPDKDICKRGLAFDVLSIRKHHLHILVNTKAVVTVFLLADNSQKFSLNTSSEEVKRIQISGYGNYWFPEFPLKLNKVHGLLLGRCKAVDIRTLQEVESNFERDKNSCSRMTVVHVQNPQPRKKNLVITHDDVFKHRRDINGIVRY